MSLCVSAQAATIHVPDDYLTIQGAVNGANSGDTIIVRDGNYTENIDVNKSNLTIKSENGAEKTIVRVAEGNYVIRVTSDYTKITGFTVEGTCYNCLYGGLYINAKNSNISHNIITQSGITLGPGCTNSIIFNNNISDSAAGIHVDGASDSTFIQNYVSNNSYGIYIEDNGPSWSRVYPRNNSFINNIASNNEFGIRLRNCMNSLFIDNIITDNEWYGIRWYYSIDNILTGNIMSGNRYNFYLYGDSDAHFNNDIDTSNLVNGRPIYYIQNAENQVYDSSTNAGTFYCIDCHNVIIKDLTLSKNEYGVYLWKTTNSKIENVNVGSNGVGIRLEYSDNNTIINNNAHSNYYMGIFLRNSNNNILISNTANSNHQGIILSSSNSNTLKYNNASLNFISGISLDNAWYNTLTNNSANLNGNKSWEYSLYGAEESPDGIYLWSSSNNILANNNVLDNVCFGIKLHGSENNTLTNNVASGNRYNFAVDEYDDIGLINNIDTSNLVNGRPVYYIENAENQVYDSSTNAGMFYCINCHNVSIKDLILSENYPGVYFWKTNNSRVENVSVLNNTYGIQLRYSNHNIFINNNISNNREGNGMDILYSNNNSFINNIFFNNRGVVSIGISNNNKIYHNNFLNSTNKPSIYQSTGNLFDNGYPSGGNYWSDYTGIDEKKGQGQNQSGSDGIGDSPYTFTGSQDRYPFMNESGWLTLAPDCYDNTKNGDETDIDCGGSCSSCEDGESCLVDADCLSGYCENNVCSTVANLFVVVTKTKFDAGEIAPVVVNLRDARGYPINGLENIEYRIDYDPWKQQSVELYAPGTYTFDITFPPEPGEHTVFVKANVGDRILNGNDTFFVNYGPVKTPVILVHDYFRGSENDLKQNILVEVLSLDYKLSETLFILDLEPGKLIANGDIKGYASKLHKKVEAVKQEAGVNKVDIVAHGMGGLVARWYLEKIDCDNVRKLIMLGTPNQGSVFFKQLRRNWNLAVNTLKIWLISMGYPTFSYDFRFILAEEQMRSNSDFIKTLNTPPTYTDVSTKYFTLAGDESPWFMSWIFWLYPPRANDGIVRVSEVKLDGIPLEVFHVNHFEFLFTSSSEPAVQRVVEILKDDPPTYQQTPSTRVKAMQQDSSVERSAQEAPMILGKINPGEEKSHEISITLVDQLRITLSWFEGDLNLTLTTPNGTLIDSYFAINDTNVTYYSNRNLTIESYAIKNPEPGAWKINVTAVNISGEEDYVIMTSFDTNITLSVLLQKYQYDINEPINIKANLTYRGEPITNASVTAKTKKLNNMTENITLYDDGLHGDNQSDDGIYSNIYTNVSLWGTYDITVTALGEINNEQFERETFACIRVEQYPDLTLNASDISFSNYAPLVGDNITISALIENIGKGDATNTTIEFYDGNPVNGTLIGEKITNIATNSTKLVSISWIAEYGVHNIYVSIPASNPFLEENYTNNLAFNSINVTGAVISLSLMMPTEVNINNSFNVTVLVENSGTELIGANISILLPAGLSTEDYLTVALGNISKNKTINWNVIANQTGIREIIINLTSKNAPDMFISKNISVFHIEISDLPANLTAYQYKDITINISITNFNPKVSYIGLYLNISIIDPSDNIYYLVNNIPLLDSGETEILAIIWNKTQEIGLYKVNVSLFTPSALIDTKQTSFKIMEYKNLTILLNQGWNLLSIPLTLENNSFNHILNNTNFSIYTYKNNSWFIPNEINNKLGYWLKINETKNLTLIGTEVEDKTIELNNGWNLIGYPYLNETDINNSDLKNHTTFGYINDSWLTYNPNRTSSLNTLDKFSPGYGYWIKK